MTIGLFMILYVAAAGAIAVWVHVRRPQMAPESLRPAFLHVLAAMVASQLLTPLILDQVGADGAPALRLLAVLGVGFPALTYACLATLWLLRLAQHLAGRPR